MSAARASRRLIPPAQLFGPYRAVQFPYLIAFLTRPRLNSRRLWAAFFQCLKVWWFWYHRMRIDDPATCAVLEYWSNLRDRILAEASLRDRETDDDKWAFYAATIVKHEQQ
jgi:hypothetical protein